MEGWMDGCAERDWGGARAGGREADWADPNDPGNPSEPFSHVGIMPRPAFLSFSLLLIWSVCL